MDFMDTCELETPLSLNHIRYKGNHYYYNDPILLKQPQGNILKGRYLKRQTFHQLRDIVTGEVFRFTISSIKPYINFYWEQISPRDDLYIRTNLDTILEVEDMFSKQHYHNSRVYIKDTLNNYLVSLLAVSLTITLMNLSPGLWKAIFAVGFLAFIAICFAMVSLSTLLWLLIKLVIFNEDL